METLENPVFNTVFLCGPAGVGKDTVGSFLDMVAGFKRLAFADAVREEYSARSGVPVECLLDRDTKEAHRSSIIALANGERDKDPFVWVKKSGLWNLWFAKERVVVTDARFQNEIHSVPDALRVYLWDDIIEARKCFDADHEAAKQRKQQHGFDPHPLVRPEDCDILLRYQHDTTDIVGAPLRLMRMLRLPHDGNIRLWANEQARSPRERTYRQYAACVNRYGPFASQVWRLCDFSASGIHLAMTAEQMTLQREESE